MVQNIAEAKLLDSEKILPKSSTIWVGRRAQQR